MTPRLSNNSARAAAGCIALVASITGPVAAWAQQEAPPSAAAPAADAAPAAPTAMTNPAMAGPLVANPDPLHLDVVPFFGPMYVGGAASGLALSQSDPVLGVDRHWHFDISNAQATLQTTSGPFQFLVEPGVYALPVVGVPYNPTRMSNSLNLFGGVPIAWGKAVFDDNFNVQFGKLPTLIGAEYMFTFQNMNIQRGLLWNQENVVNQGVQANLTTGPVAWALSLNDGFYSGNFNWLTGSATWTIDPANSLIVAGGGALGRNTAVGPATPVPQNNSTIVDVSYTYNAAPWTITPYVQFTHVGADPVLGIGQDASTYGGAILANYKVNDFVNVAGRWEYLASSGSAAKGAPNLLGYGPGSSAMSFTLTPTFQSGVYFLRGEASVIQAFSITPGSGFGTGKGNTQARFLVETGVVF